MKQKKLALAACAAAAFVAMPAFATSSASINLKDFKVTLYSLSPNSPFVPTITFDNTNYTYSSAETYDHGDSNYQHSNFKGAGSSTVNTASSHSSISVSGLLNSAGTPISIDSSGSSSGSVEYPGATNWFQAGTSVTPVTFTLSANTYAVFSTTGSGAATTTVGYDPTTGQSESSFAFTYLQINGSNGYNGTQNSYDQFTLYASYTRSLNPATGNWVYTGQSVAQSGELQVSFANTTKTSLTGNLYLTSYVDGSSNITAVPEPETYGMLLAGLGMIGVAVKRRKAKQA